MAKKQKELVKINCPECGGGARNHRVLYEHRTGWQDDEMGIWKEDEYQICQCAGCDAVRFRWTSWFAEDIDDYGKPVPTIRVYPEQAKGRSPQVESRHLPEVVERIYEETIQALNAGATILAGAGLRAIVEAICKDQNVPGKNLQRKIDALESQHLLAEPQAALLHEERYIGNAALHEIAPPAEADLKDGLHIIEGLLNTLYVLPKRAKRLRDARESKGKAPQKTARRRRRKKGGKKKKKGKA